MASSTCAISTAVPLTRATTHKTTTSASFLKPPLPVQRATSNGAVSRKFKAVAAVLTASMVVPNLAEAASGVSASLKNFLLSIVTGGFVLGAIIGAIVGVSDFDPVNNN